MGHGEVRECGSDIVTHAAGFGFVLRTKTVISDQRQRRFLSAWNEREHTKNSHSQAQHFVKESDEPQSVYLILVKRIEFPIIKLDERERAEYTPRTRVRIHPFRCNTFNWR